MIMVWVLTTKIQLQTKSNDVLNKNIITLYNFYKTHYTIIKLINVNVKNLNILTFKNSFTKTFFNILYYTKIVNIKYIGKIFKIKKFKKILILTFNYPIFKYLIYNNIRLKWRKKPKRIFFFFLKTYSNIAQMFWYNLIYLRPLNTYTTRGIYNNLFYYHKRKKKITNKR